MLPIQWFLWIIQMLTSGKHPEQTIRMPAVLHESSGLCAIGDSLFVSHNDSGNAPNLYFFNYQGQLVLTLEIANATNHDWEDLTLNNLNGDLYIADIGNNAARRQDEVFSFYKILAANWQQALSSKDRQVIVKAEPINFTYPSSPHNAEAAIYFNDTIWIFTKHSTKKQKKLGFMRCFAVPAQAAVSPTNAPIQAQLADSLFVGSPVTSAVFSFEQQCVWLLSYGQITKIETNHPGKLQGKTKRVWSLPPFLPPQAQTEAIAILPNGGQIVITNEKGWLWFLSGFP